MNPSENIRRRSKRLNEQSSETGNSYVLGKIPTPGTGANVKCITVQETISGKSNCSHLLVRKRTCLNDIRSYEGAAIGTKGKKKSGACVKSFEQNFGIDI